MGFKDLVQRVEEKDMMLMAAVASVGKHIFGYKLLETSVERQTIYPANFFMHLDQPVMLGTVIDDRKLHTHQMNQQYKNQKQDLLKRNRCGSSYFRG
jgi:2-hydroxy-3-keto-5-methylthiopentenyl-1-phosphate phosphatase